MGKLLEQTVFEAFKTIIYYFKTRRGQVLDETN